MPPLPTGTVTFLFTDVEGSTRLWEEHPTAMRAALVQHDALIELLADVHHGAVVRPRGEGDSRFCVFARASDAVGAAGAIQRALREEAWPTGAPLRVRMALHTGEADLRDEDYYGSAVNRCARLRSIAHGGQTLLSQATHDLVRGAADGVGFRDLGEHRLRDLSAPERVYQLMYPALADEFPPPLSLDVVPNNLPLQVTSFVGREEELAEVEHLLDESRLVTLTGAGGAGKTRLSLQTAADVADRFRDGVWFVELAPISEPTLVPATALAALGLREAPGRAPVDTLVDHLGARQALIVLDNCEHLVEPAARLADALIRRCPDVRVLASSREMLGVAGEVAWRTPSLPAPDPERPGTPDEIASFPAVQLFVERARAVQPRFRLSPANAAAVARICARLDGIPLAIELAAARVAVLSPEQIADRLRDRFRLLTGGSRTALRRQQTLKALVDWSYDLLNDDERVLLRRLAVFSGGWTIEAAEAIGGFDPLDRDGVLDLLASLVQKSLVVADDSGQAVRYRMLETIRQYGEEKLFDSGEAAELRNRHRDWFAQLARLRSGEDSGDDTGGRVERIAPERENLRAALEWCRSGEDGAQGGLGMAADMHWFWSHQGLASEGTGWLETFLAGRPEPDALRARGLLALEFLYRLHSNYRRARSAGEDALVIALEIGDDLRAADAMARLGLTDATLGEYESARRRIAEAVAVGRAHQAPHLILHRLRDLGLVYGCARDFAAARACFDESLELARQLNLTGGAAAMALMRLGMIERFAGNLARARGHIEEALSMLRKVDRESGGRVGLARCALASLALAEGRADEARAVYADALHRIDPAERSLGLWDCLSLFGILAAATGQPERAVRLIGAGSAVTGRPGTVHTFDTRIDAEDALAACRGRLDPAVYDAAWREGLAMPIEQAVPYALEGS